MPGLGTSVGRGGATTFLQDLVNADCILIEGSNFAEAHPVGFRFVMQAKERGAKIIHVDPRYTRTSAVADLFVPIRSGTDIVFLGGIINYVLQRERYFADYVRAYTNASSIVTEKYQDTEDLDGLFSGFTEPKAGEDATSGQAHEGSANAHEQGGEEHGYDASTWAFEFDEVAREDGNGTAKVVRCDPTFQHPRCVLNILKRHFSRYTPEMVEAICGSPQEKFLDVCESLAQNSGRERTTAFAYAVGWTQHTIGVQYIRTAAILQLLLGNIGRPGGGIMALRGHANIQGATDIATLYDLLPGYLPMPSLKRDEQTLDAYLKTNAKASGWWTNMPKYVVSILKAFYGKHATAENDFCFAYLPQLSGDHSMLPTTFAMKDGNVEGYFVIGQNPGSSGQNAKLFCAAMERLQWFVNIDSYENETSSFWKREGADPSSIGTECFFIPAATILEKEGTMVNTSRLLQYHDKAVEPAGDSVTDAWVFYQLGKRLKALYADSKDPKDRPIQHMTWDYEHDDPHERTKGEPSVVKVLKEINGYDTQTGDQIRSFTDLKDDGSTACGGWIYCGVYPDASSNKARNRRPDDYTSLDWGFSWPANRRMLYNRASADPDGKPWSERKKYLWWDEAASEWTGPDVPDFPKKKAPSTKARPGAGGIDEHSGADPFIMQLDGRGQLFVASGLKDGPLPVHYEPLASVVHNQLYGQQNNPLLKEWKRSDNAYNGAVNPNYPYVLTTYRITEMSGIMTRYVPWLAELQPEAFCEIDPELAVEKGILNREWVTISTALGEIEARALVSGRMKPLRIGRGQRVHQIGLPYNYGNFGFTSGDTADELIPLSMDPNVSIHEAKTLTCSIRAGRRARHVADATERAVSAAQRTDMGQPSLHGKDSSNG
ncbi:MAG: formate dehydrogenase-N subunit alpha [Candidatus Eremiobacteraeota bacterium]|nr:formate dehydrogenase-N subunit alpha [Candidatus Eremiobacteraeota bacterium]